MSTQDWTTILSDMLSVRQMNPKIHPAPHDCFDITFTHVSGGRYFTGRGQVCQDFASAELWLRHRPTNRAALTEKLAAINTNPIMMEAGNRWMRFAISADHLAFVAQLSELGKPLSIETMGHRLEHLIALVENELSSLTSV